MSRTRPTENTATVRVPPRRGAGPGRIIGKRAPRVVRARLESPASIRSESTPQRVAASALAGPPSRRLVTRGWQWCESRACARMRRCARRGRRGRSLHGSAAVAEELGAGEFAPRSTRFRAGWGGRALAIGDAVGVGARLPRTAKSCSASRRVNGHRFLPGDGHRFSPVADMFSPRWWPAVLPSALSSRSPEAVGRWAERR